nr:YraN family protein [Neisseria meningitidis]
MRLNHKQGEAGEDAALAFLQSQGCTLLARNWHCAYGEIDLIVKNGGMIQHFPIQIIETATKCRVLSATEQVDKRTVPPRRGTD